MFDALSSFHFLPFPVVSVVRNKLTVDNWHGILCQLCAYLYSWIRSSPILHSHCTFDRKLRSFILCKQFTLSFAEL